MYHCPCEEALDLDAFEVGDVDWVLATSARGFGEHSVFRKLARPSELDLCHMSIGEEKKVLHESHTKGVGALRATGGTFGAEFRS